MASALQQTWPAVEVIVADDGSTDDSLAIARRHACDRVQVLALPHRGACAARNAARQASRGEFLQYLDADDLLLPDKIERQMRRFERVGGAPVLLAAEWSRFTVSPAEARLVPDALWQDLDPVTWQTLALEGNLMMHPAAWLVARELSDAAGEWDETLTLNDDGEYFARVRFASSRIQFCPGARSLYRSGRPDSLSAPNSRTALQSAFHSHELIHALLLRHDGSERARRACADGWMHFAYAATGVASDLALEASRQAQALGGSRLEPPGGRLFRLACRLFGWRRTLDWRHRHRS